MSTTFLVLVHTAPHTTGDWHRFSRSRDALAFGAATGSPGGVPTGDARALVFQVVHELPADADLVGVATITQIASY